MHSLDPTGDTSSVVQDLMDIWLQISCWCAGTYCTVHTGASTVHTGESHWLRVLSAHELMHFDGVLLNSPQE